MRPRCTKRKGFRLISGAKTSQNSQALRIGRSQGRTIFSSFFNALEASPMSKMHFPTPSFQSSRISDRNRHLENTSPS